MNTAKPMTHTPTTNRTSAVAMQEIADHLTALLLGVREQILKHRAPKDAAHHQLRRDVKRGHAKPAKMVFAIALADLEDGAPLAEVTRFFVEAIAFLTQRDKELHAERAGIVVPSLLPLMVKEARAEARLNEAQLRAAQNPDDEAALEEMIAASRAYDAPQERMENAARERLTAIRSRHARQMVSA